jgi:hypothetical protein
LAAMGLPIMPPAPRTATRFKTGGRATSR